MRAAWGQRRLPRISRVSTSSWKSATSIAEYRLSTAENARSEPTSAPVWESAARAAASERPTLRQTTGLPASAHRRNASTKASGRRTVSRKSPTASVEGSSAKNARKSAASVTASAPDDTTQRSPMRPPSERNASASEPDWHSTAT